MSQSKEKKLEEIIELVNKVQVDPDIEVEYCIPGVETTADSCSIDSEPYILVRYVVSEYTQPTRRIRLRDTYLEQSAEKIANLVTFSIEQFKGDIDSVEIN